MSEVLRSFGSRRPRQGSATVLMLILAMAVAIPYSAGSGGPASAEEADIRALVAEGPRLSEVRVLSYYGHPHEPRMGILGEYNREELLIRLQEQAAEYEAADPSRPVVLAFEVIASVAQGEPGADGSYLLYTDAATIDAYAEFTAAHDMILILDVQVGRKTVAEEIEAVMPWLRLPHVHLAIDPEFSMAPGQTPGIHIGSIDATDIRYAQETLAALSEAEGLPPKILIIHQFVHQMITNKHEVEPVPGVQLVIDADGWGPPELKIETYTAVITNEPIEYHGFKLFYRQDEPLMSPEDVVNLNPPPEFVMYQ